MEVLCCIDMQEFFYPRNRRQIRKIQETIEKSKEKEDLILLVEFNGCGRTIKVIEESIDGYHLVHRVGKRENSGAKEIIQELKRKKVSKDATLKICGLYTNCCISDTVGELARKTKYKIKVLDRACCGTTRQMHLLGIKDMASYSTVEIVKGDE